MMLGAAGADAFTIREVGRALLGHQLAGNMFTRLQRRWNEPLSDGKCFNARCATCVSVLPRKFARKSLRLSLRSESLFSNLLVLQNAKVAELADAPDLGSGGETRGGSSPPFRTKNSRRGSLQWFFLCAQFCAHPATESAPTVVRAWRADGRLAPLCRYPKR